MQRRLQHAFAFPQPPHEGHADDVGARFHRRAHFQAAVGRQHVSLPLGIAWCVARVVLGRRHALPFAADRKPFQQDAVEPDVELMRLAHANDVVVKLALELDFEEVLSVDRKLVRDGRAAT